MDIFDYMGEYLACVKVEQGKKAHQELLFEIQEWVERELDISIDEIENP